MTIPEVSLDTFRARVSELSERFVRQAERYRSASYNEETARSEFISPLFEALGWDVANRSGHALQYRDVIHEEGIKVGDATKAPDYTFRIGGQRKFFVEAKKPGVNLKGDPAPAYQLRRYAWSAKLPLSILTDFEELAVYDTRIRPKEGDKPSVARVFYFRHDEYEARAAEIWNVFAKRAVLEGSFDAYAEDNRRKRGTSEVDSEFLKEIEGWREELAKNLALRNDGLSVDELNYAVQATIDRILFLRIAEGRGAELYGRLLGLTNAGGIYERLTALYREADERYNSGLFDFEADRLSLALKLDDKVLKPILTHLYYPQSPYEFSVLPPEILGNVYEQFLGKVIRLTAGGRAKVEEKPEVKKAGGVYYTPSYIVDYIVANTVGKLVEGKPPKEMAKLRVLDPACGSGSFLLVAYQRLLDAHLAWYREHEPKKHKEAIFEGPGGDWRLTTTEKRKILLQSIYGVDIDRQAVEVTKLSLLLKCLEGETNETLRQMNLYGERALPSLEKNIQCGNSLISPQALLQHTGGLFPDQEEMRRINPFDWQKAFPGVFQAGGFDAVIGNPPYIRIQAMTEWAPLEVGLYRRNYLSAETGNYDVYVVFVEKSLDLLRDNGLLGMILPHRFFKAEYGRGLRKQLASGQNLRAIIDFDGFMVFPTASINTCILLLNRKPTKSFFFHRIKELRRPGTDPRRLLPEIPEVGAASANWVRSEALRADAWPFILEHEEPLWERLQSLPVRLGDACVAIFQGLKTGCDPVFIGMVISAGASTTELEFSIEGHEVVAELETELLRPLFKSGQIQRYNLAPAERAIIFPYIEGRLRSASELSEKFPRTWAHLMTHRIKLEARDHGALKGEHWYGYSRNQALSVISQPKLLTPDYYAFPSFAIDSDGTAFFCGGGAGGYGIVLRPEFSPFAMLGLLNSRLVRWYLTKTSVRAYETALQYTRQYIEPLPLPASRSKRLEGSIAALAERMIGLRAQSQAARIAEDRERTVRSSEAFDAEIDRLVYELYELTPEEIAVVEKG